MRTKVFFFSLLMGLVMVGKDGIFRVFESTLPNG